ncbi:MAG: 2'-5' RNA ligase family protein [Scytonematopsis contorta HA4267-MV1]|jgi:2'-5' RNA ligase|nr:2'-5' RNA ligase family protein [Scytonematopsis contorta HA4267-MV1]
MDKSKSYYFIALLPPKDIQNYANEVKQYFADKYNSRHAQKSPPHITLQPPFQWSNADELILESKLREFASVREAIPITLLNFAAFSPHVIYIDVVKFPQLMTLQAELMVYVESNLGIIDKAGKSREFAPHMTVAFKDLTKQNFKAAWSEFEKREIHFEFTAENLTLLQHDGTKWDIKSEFPFI